MTHIELTGSNTVREVLNTYPDYKLFIRKGYAYRGAREVLEDKETKMTACPGGFRVMSFEERMKRMYDFYVAFDIDIDTDKQELHINAFSENDMY